MKEGISRIEESKSLIRSGEQRSIEAMIEKMNSNLSKMTRLRDQLQNDRHLTETDLESRIANYEETVQMAEDVIAAANKLWDHLTLRSMPQRVDTPDGGGNTGATSSICTSSVLRDPSVSLPSPSAIACCSGDLYRPHIAA